MYVNKDWKEIQIYLECGSSIIFVFGFYFDFARIHIRSFWNKTCKLYTKTIRTIRNRALMTSGISTSQSVDRIGEKLREKQGNQCVFWKTREKPARFRALQLTQTSRGLNGSESWTLPNGQFNIFYDFSLNHNWKFHGFLFLKIFFTKCSTDSLWYQTKFWIFSVLLETNSSYSYSYFWYI